MTLPVTALTAAICALLLIFTMFRVIGQRIRTETVFGAGDDETLDMVRGIHANLAENAPIAILLIGLLELANAHHWTLTGLAGLFLVSRVLHIIGMYQSQAGKLRFRQAGVLGTTIAIVGLAGWTLYLFVTVNLAS